MKPRKLLWTEGLFITQHHLQQLDRYHEWRLSQRLRSALAYDWGVAELEIDDRALAAEEFKLNRLTAVLPDGSILEYGDGAGDPIAPRAFASAFPTQARTLDVYVALMHEIDDKPNVDLEGRAGAALRYVREQASVADWNSGQGEHAVQYARPNAVVLFGDERRDAFDAVRVAQIVRTTAGAPALRETFVPPLLRVGASPYLVGRFRRLLAAMTSKQRALAESRRQRANGAVEMTAADVPRFWVLGVLNATIPVFAHVVDHGGGGPDRAYLALAQFIGQLCTLAVDGDPTAIPKFNYLELGDVFEPMFERAHRLLDAVLPERYVEIALNKREDGMCLGQITDPKLLRHAFFLAASGPVPEAQLREQLPQLTKIASWTQMNSILNGATRGVKLEMQYNPPGALPVKPGVLFFKVERTPGFWNDIAGTGTIAIYQPIDPQRIELRLYAVDPTSLQ